MRKRPKKDKKKKKRQKRNNILRNYCTVGMIERLRFCEREREHERGK